MFTLLDFSVSERAPGGLAVLTLGTTTRSDLASRHRLRLNSDVLESVIFLTCIPSFRDFEYLFAKKARDSKN